MNTNYCILPNQEKTNSDRNERSQQHLLTRDPVTAFSDSDRPEERSQQLELFAAPEARLFHQKPQIVSIPGISPKVRNRYKVMLGREVLGTELDLDAALQLADSTNAVNSSNNLKSR